MQIVVFYTSLILHSATPQGIISAELASQWACSSKQRGILFRDGAQNSASEIFLAESAIYSAISWSVVTSVR